MKKKLLRLLIILSIIACITLTMVGCNGPSLPSPINLKVDAAVTVLSWNSVAGARGYQVEIKKDNSKDTDVVDVRRVSYGISHLETRVTYTFRVRAIGDKVNNSDSKWSEEFTVFKPFENGMTFRSINSSTEYEVAGIGSAASSTTVVEIPDMYRGKPVTRIGNSAFYNNSRITQITIPNTIVEIGESAFRNCLSLTDIEIPDSVVTIGKSAFQGCSNLTAAKIPTSENFVEIPANMFYGCLKLRNLDLGNSVKVIGANAFFNCKELGIETKTVDPEDESIFTATYNDIVLPDSVVEIGETAFSKCASIKKLVLGENVKTIGAGAFRECLILEEFEFNDAVETIGSNAFTTCPQIESFVLPNSVIELGDYVFAGCSSLNEIILSENLAKLGRGVFESTSFWEDAEEGDLIYIGNWLVGLKFPEVEDDPVGPTNIDIVPGTIGIAAHALHCIAQPDENKQPVGSALQTVTIPASVRTIGVSAFQDSVLLTTVTIGTSDSNRDSELTLIDEGAFYQCLSLDTFNLYGEKLETIGNQAFAECERLGRNPSNSSSVKEIYLPESLRLIGTRAFYNTFFWSHYTGVVYAGGWVVGFNSEDSTNAVIDSTKNGVPTVGISNYAFYKLDALETVSIADSVKYIGKAAFYKSPALKSVRIPDGVTRIEDYTFYNCYALHNIDLNNVEEVGDYAFFNAGSEEVGEGVNPAIVGTENIRTVGTYSFYNNAYITEFEFGENLTSVGARAFFGMALTSLEIPGSLTEIGAYAFANNEELSSVIINDGVETIGRYAFSNDAAITSIELPASVVTIGEYAFRNNTALSEIKLNEGLVTISKSAFVNCAALTNIEIPSTVKSIGNMAFRGCTGLTGVILRNTIEQMGMHVFYGTKVTFYTDMTALPTLSNETWSPRWNSANRPIIFGCELAVDENGNTYVKSVTINNGTLSIYSTNKPKENETEIKDPIVGPSRDGYTFKGWAISADSDTVAFEAQYIFAADKDLTLYAVWESNTPAQPESPVEPGEGTEE